MTGDGVSQCPDRLLIEESLRKALPEDQQDRIAAHLGECERCRSVLEEIREDDRITTVLREARQERPAELRARLTSSMTRLREKLEGDTGESG